MNKLLYSFCFLLISLFAIAGGNNSIYVPDGANFIVYNRGADTYILTQAKIGEANFNRILNRLSSGKRINTSADDPAGLAVSEKMDSMLEQIKRDSMNDEDMRNLHNFVESMIAQDQDIVQRIRELAVSATNGILGAEDRELIQTEIEQLVAQIDMNAKFTQFNKVNVISELTSTGLGLDEIDVVHNPEKAIDIADRVLEALTVKRVMQGVKANILTFRIEGKSYYYMNLQAAESRISDMDMAEGISDLVTNSVLLKTRYGTLMQGK